MKTKDQNTFQLEVLHCFRSHSHHLQQSSVKLVGCEVYPYSFEPHGSCWHVHDGQILRACQISSNLSNTSSKFIKFHQNSIASPCFRTDLTLHHIFFFGCIVLGAKIMTLPIAALFYQGPRAVCRQKHF